MTELFHAIASWHSLLMLVLVFGFAPGFILRLIVKIYPHEDPRRRELIAQLYVLGRIERLLFVGEQLETVLMEGIPLRIRALRSQPRSQSAPQSGRHDNYLNLLDSVITTIGQLRLDTIQTTTLAYRRAQPVIGSKLSANTYRFELNGPAPPIYGAVVELDGASSLEGTVQYSAGSKLVVKFRNRIDRMRVPRQGSLRQVPALEVRQRRAVSELREDRAVNPHLLDILASRTFGSFIIDNTRTLWPESSLNQAQIQAVSCARTVPDLLLITAPPGTGKNRTIVEIIRQCVTNGERVLVVSATRLARDQFLERLPRDLNPLCLCLLGSGKAHGETHRHLVGDVGQAGNNVKVAIGTWLSAILSEVATKFDFDVLIVDEAAGVGLLDILPLLVSVKRAVLLGDHRQLRPFVDSTVRDWLEQLSGSPENAMPVSDVKALVTVSAFELFLEYAPDSRVVSLFQQRRMPPAVAEFVSRHFYNGELTSDVWQNHSDLSSDGLLASPFTIIDTSVMPRSVRLERIAGRGFVNDLEAEIIVRLIADKSNSEHDCAVIVPYRAQSALIKDQLSPNCNNATQIGTIDSFKGQEFDVVIVGLTRSNDHGNVGFLTELRRLNVAMTRARRQLVIVGDWRTLTAARDPQVKAVMADMLIHAQRKGEVLTSMELMNRLTSRRPHGVVQQ